MQKLATTNRQGSRGAAAASSSSSCQGIINTDSSSKTTWGKELWLLGQKEGLMLFPLSFTQSLSPSNPAKGHGWNVKKCFIISESSCSSLIPINPGRVEIRAEASDLIFRCGNPELTLYTHALHSDHVPCICDRNLVNIEFCL